MQLVKTHTRIQVHMKAILYIYKVRVDEAT